jgi:DNA-directed RNA polymerase sigma subunit (sigma70/sigma32)
VELNSLQTYIKELNQALQAEKAEEVNTQFKKLIALEIKFTKRLKVLPNNKQVYLLFIREFIKNKERDLRDARPYFRERLNMYKTVINPAIERSNYKALYHVKTNFLFCAFVIHNIAKPDMELTQIYSEIKSLREDLIHRHLHHAISHAKRFKMVLGNTVEFNDLIQCANEALISAVDKYVIDKHSSEFHNMAMGFMIAYMISSGGLTLPVSIGPKAFRLLYRIRKLLSKTPGMSSKQISEITETAELEITELLNLSRTASLNKPLGPEGEGRSTVTLQDFLPSPVNERTDPYLMLESKNLINTAAELFKNLTLLQQKALRLKGIRFENYMEEV